MGENNRPNVRSAHNKNSCQHLLTQLLSWPFPFITSLKRWPSNLMDCHEWLSSPWRFAHKGILPPQIQHLATLSEQFLPRLLSCWDTTVCPWAYSEITADKQTISPLILSKVNFNVIPLCLRPGCPRVESKRVCALQSEFFPQSPL